MSSASSSQLFSFYLPRNKIDSLFLQFVKDTIIHANDTYRTKIMSSARYNRNKHASQSVDKKFCGVCKNAGLSEREYTSHFTKSVPGPKGIVVCPTILQNVCSFCKCQGHFKANCSELKRMNRRIREDEVAAKRSHYATATASVSKKKQTQNRFAALDSDEEEEQTIHVNVSAKTFASIAANGAITSGTLEMPKKVSTTNLAGFTVITKDGQSHICGEASRKQVIKKQISWFDDDSSDDEED